MEALANEADKMKNCLCTDWVDLNILLSNVLADIEGHTVLSEDVKLINLNRRKEVKGFIEANKEVLYPRSNELRRLLNELDL